MSLKQDLNITTFASVHAMAISELHILGSASATPTRDRHPSAQVLNISNTKILVDCGEGTQMQLMKYGIKSGSIDYICISHLHGDHYFGLVGLLSTFSLMGRKQPLHLIGPEALKPIIDLQVAQSLMPLTYEVVFYPTNPDKPETVISNDQFSLRTFPMQHRIPCTGFVITERKAERPLNKEACDAAEVPVAYYRSIKAGNDYVLPSGKTIPNAKLTFEPVSPKSFAYCSDTIFDESLVQYIQGADLLYHESTYLHNLEDKARERYHSTARQAGIIASQAAVKRLIIGHFSSRYENLEPFLEEARTEFINTELALEGAVFSL